MYSIDLANKILELCTKANWVKFWIPTRMYKFKKFHDVLNRMKALPNVMVRYSSDEIDGSYTAGLHGSTILPTADSAATDVFVCNAPSNGGKCGACRACYDKSIGVIGYVAHGRKMAKVIRIAQVQ